MAGHEFDESFIRQWHGRVFATCQSMLRCPMDAEDATQETFVRALRAAGTVMPTIRCRSAWLRGIARHVCIDQIRRNVVRQTSTELQSQRESKEDTETTFSADAIAEQRETHALLVQRIHGLPQALREVVLLHYFDDMTYEEMAQWLGVARSTVGERLATARQRLHHELIACQVN
ncbi:MAG: sigma-70 family RNA polymerase sigma factor [Planctomycetota bacterium]